jgi:hypothetical protein
VLARLTLLKESRCRNAEEEFWGERVTTWFPEDKMFYAR